MTDSGCKNKTDTSKDDKQEMHVQGKSKHITKMPASGLHFKQNFNQVAFEFN